MKRTKLFGILVVALLGAINWQLYQQGQAIEAMWQQVNRLGEQVNDMQDQIDSATAAPADDPALEPLQCEPEQPGGKRI